jgi:hypothetical protein
MRGDTRTIELVLLYIFFIILHTETISDIKPGTSIVVHTETCRKNAVTVIIIIYIYISYQTTFCSKNFRQLNVSLVIEKLYRVKFDPD